MKVEPVTNKPQPTFGIYKERITTRYGYKDIGQFKDKIITIHHDNRNNTKMWYVTDKLGKWIKSKLLYFHNGIKKIVRSKSANEF